MVGTAGFHGWISLFNITIPCLAGNVDPWDEWAVILQGGDLQTVFELFSLRWSAEKGRVCSFDGFGQGCWAIQESISHEGLILLLTKLFSMTNCRHNNWVLDISSLSKLPISSIISTRFVTCCPNDTWTLLVCSWCRVTCDLLCFVSSDAHKFETRLHSAPESVEGFCICILRGSTHYCAIAPRG